VTNIFELAHHALARVRSAK